MYVHLDIGAARLERSLQRRESQLERVACASAPRTVSCTGRGHCASCRQAHARRRSLTIFTLAVKEKDLVGLGGHDRASKGARARAPLEDCHEDRQQQAPPAPPPAAHTAGKKKSGVAGAREPQGGELEREGGGGRSAAHTSAGAICKRNCRCGCCGPLAGSSSLHPTPPPGFKGRVFIR